MLAALAAAGGELPLRRLVRAVPRAARRLPRLVDAGLVEVGDEVQNRRPPPTVAYARAIAARRRDALPQRAAAKRALAGQAGGGAGDGLRGRRRCRPAERATLRALVAAGLARVEHRPVARAPEARAAAAPRRGSR